MQLLPPPKDCCPVCAVKHEPHEAHNRDSLYYQYRFYGLRGRWPTWGDAVAHLDELTRAKWIGALTAHGVWSEPEGEPIADPPMESIHQPIGAIDDPGFGPKEASP